MYRIVICKNEDQLAQWYVKLTKWIDIAQHNTRPANPCELERRLRKEKTSLEGALDNIHITDKDQLRAIAEWRENRAAIRNSEGGAASPPGGGSASPPSMAPGPPPPRPAKGPPRPPMSRPASGGPPPPPGGHGKRP